MTGSRLFPLEAFQRDVDRYMRNTRGESMEQKQTETELTTDVSLSWLTRIAVMLGLGSTSHAMTSAERREKLEKDLEDYMRGKLPEVVRGGDVLPLVFYPNPILREKSVLVSDFSDDFRQLVRSMGATMYLTGGVGLSAIQVGVPLRVFVADVRHKEETVGDFRVLVNPTIIDSSGRGIDAEGCLSMPNVRESIARPTYVKIQAQDARGKVDTHELHGWGARIALHEMEHLDGAIFIDQLGPLHRRLIEKRIGKLRRSVEIDEERAERRTAIRAAKGRGR